jgi:hypothetical protein
MIHKYCIISNTFIFLLSIATWYSSKKNMNYIEEKHEEDYDYVLSRISKLEKQLNDKDKEFIKLENRVKYLKNIVIELDDLLSSTKNKEIQIETPLKIINPDVFIEYNYYLKEQCQAPYYLKGIFSKENEITPIDNEWTPII